MKLYRIVDPSGNTYNDLYVYSTHTDEQLIRGFVDYQDHGGMSVDDYYRVAKRGKIEEITSLDQIQKEDRAMIPYNTNEIDDCDPPSIFQFIYYR